MALTALRVVRATLMVGWLVATAGLMALVALPHAMPHLEREVYTVRGASMEPAIPLGALVVVRRVDPTEIAVGEVITYGSSNGTVVTHRVLAVTTGGELSFLTKGDASEAVEATLAPAMSLIGRVEHVLPAAGFVMAALSSTIGAIAALVMLGGLLLLIWFLDELLAWRHRPSAYPAPAAGLASAAGRPPAQALHDGPRLGRADTQPAKRVARHL